MGILNGFQTLFNFSRKTEIHNIYSGKYAQIATEINTQLTRHKRFRVAMDSFLEKITISLAQLEENAYML